MVLFYFRVTRKTNASALNYIRVHLRMNGKRIYDTRTHQRISSLPMECFSYLFMSKCVILFCNHSISVSTRARSTYVQAIHNQNDVMMNTCVTMIAQWGPVSAMKSSSTFLEHHTTCNENQNHHRSYILWFHLILYV